MPPIYDLTLGGIAFPTMEQTFTETVGGDYVLVGAAVMPGPPTPASTYNLTIPVYGDPQETDPTGFGFALRLQIRTLLQNDAMRFAGLQLTTSFDPDLDGWLVIGTADIGYGTGGATFGDFVLTINGAALIPGMQVLQAHRLVAADRRLSGAQLDRQGRVYRTEPLTSNAEPVHYLPVGAHDVLGQVGRTLVQTEPYDTIFGEGLVARGRTHGETLSFEQDQEDVNKGAVRVMDRRGNDDPKLTTEGDIDPEKSYGWLRAFGNTWRFQKGEIPVMDNGRCRIIPHGSALDIQQSKDGKYVDTNHVTFGYPDVGAISLVSWSPERAQIKFPLHGAHKRAEVLITLQRGWAGPQIDVYHQGDSKGNLKISGTAHEEEDGNWSHARVGAFASEALFETRGHHTLIPRS